MSNMEWWQRGEAGEQVLDNVEYYLINNDDVIGFCRWATEFGIHISGIRRILEVHNEGESSESSHSINKEGLSNETTG